MLEAGATEMKIFMTPRSEVIRLTKPQTVLARIVSDQPKGVQLATPEPDGGLKATRARTIKVVPKTREDATVSRDVVVHARVAGDEDRIQALEKKLNQVIEALEKLKKSKGE